MLIGDANKNTFFLNFEKRY